MASLGRKAIKIEVGRYTRMGMASESVGPTIGSLYTWWRGDPLVLLPPLGGLTIGETSDPRVLEPLTGLRAADLEDRFSAGHRAYVAWLDGRPVAYGWVATARAEIGELGLTFEVPLANRYLWDFITLPPWRGLGIYPRLLQAILHLEEAAERFWVGHDAPNLPSRRGILKAGFQEVGRVHRTVGGELVLVPTGSLERALAAAHLLGIWLPAGPVEGLTGGT